MRHILGIAGALIVGFTVGTWLAGGGMVSAQSTLEPEGTYRLVDSGVTKFLWNTRTGDTWRFYVNSATETMGWQYHALPPQVDGCTVDNCGTVQVPQLPQPGQ